MQPSDDIATENNITFPTTVAGSKSRLIDSCKETLCFEVKSTNVITRCIMSRKYTNKYFIQPEAYKLRSYLDKQLSYALII
jgi:hypothetical protein